MKPDLQLTSTTSSEDKDLQLEKILRTEETRHMQLENAVLQSDLDSYRDSEGHEV